MNPDHEMEPMRHLWCMYATMAACCREQTTSGKGAKIPSAGSSMCHAFVRKPHERKQRRPGPSPSDVHIGQEEESSYIVRELSLPYKEIFLLRYLGANLAANVAYVASFDGAWIHLKSDTSILTND